MSKSKKTKEALAPTCNFRKAVEDTPDVVNGYCFGLQALENVDKSAVTLKEMAKKKEWLQKWLTSKAPSLNKLPSGCPRFLWAATESGVHISKQASHIRKLAQLGFNPKRPVIIG